MVFNKEANIDPNLDLWYKPSSPEVYFYTNTCQIIGASDQCVRSSVISLLLFICFEVTLSVHYVIELLLEY